MCFQFLKCNETSIIVLKLKLKEKLMNEWQFNSIQTQENIGFVVSKVRMIFMNPTENDYEIRQLL